MEPKTFEIWRLLANHIWSFQKPVKQVNNGMIRVKRFESLVFNKYQTKAQNQQNRYLATKFSKCLLSILLNKILCAAFGTWPSGGVPDGHVPNAAHKMLFKRILPLYVPFEHFEKIEIWLGPPPKHFDDFMLYCKSDFILKHVTETDVKKLLDIVKIKLTSKFCSEDRPFNNQCTF